jgi:hypothetical protein
MASDIEFTRLLAINTSTAGSKFRSMEVTTTPVANVECVAQVSLKAQVIVEILVLKSFKAVDCPRDAGG